MTEREYPKISIITVVFNGAHLLEKTIRSVAALNYPRKEYIVIDGKSTDGTLKLLEQNDSYINRWISESDKGIYDAMNKGIRMATGQWIIFMNCGDWFYSKDCLSAINFNSPADILYGDALVIYPSFQTVFTKTSLPQLWKRMPFCHQACFVNSSLMKEYEFDLTYKLSSDFHFLYKAYNAKKKFEYFRQTICYFSYEGDSSSQKNALLSLKERKRIVLSSKPSMKKCLYYFGEEIYLQTALFSKRLLGNKNTEWITRYLRK